MKKIQTIQELKRRGYSVVETPDNGLLVEKGTFWGHFAYDTGVGKNNSHLHWGRTILLCFVYGLGIVGGVYWLIRKNVMEKEVISLTQ